VRHLALGQDFVAAERVTLGVVRANAVGLAGALEAVVVVATFVLQGVAHIGVGEVAVETELHILDFSRGDGVIVVGRGLLEEALVKHGLEEELEVAHPSGVVTVLVLGVDGDETEVALVLDGLVLGECRHANGALDDGHAGDGPEETEHTLLHKNG
jgi:hypothetical protein